MVLNFCISSDDALYLYQVPENISKGFRFICKLKFAKRHNSVNTLSGVMVLVLFRLSDNTLYLYQVLPKYLICFQSYGP